jgi:hypothetical protein
MVGHFIGPTVSFDNVADVKDLTYNGPGTAVFAAKYNSAGALQWAFQVGDGNSSCHAFGVAIDTSGNIIIVGDFFGTADFGGVSKTSTLDINNQHVLPDIFVAKYKPDGTLMWVTTFGGSSVDSAKCVAVDANGNIYFASIIESSSVVFGSFTLGSTNGLDQIAAVKLAPGSQGSPGTVSWAKQWGGNNSNTPFGIAIDPAGRVVLVGAFQGTSDFGNGSKTSLGGQDIFIYTYSTTDGTFDNGSWGHVFGTAGNDQAYGVAVDQSDGSVIVTGSMGGPTDFSGSNPSSPLGPGGIFLVVFNRLGVYQPNRSKCPNVTSFSGNDRGYAVVVDSASNVTFSGRFVNSLYFGGPSSVLGSQNCFIASYDKTGTWRWNKGDSGATSYPGGIALDSLGHVLAGGSFVGTLRLDQADPNSPILSNPNGPATAPFLIQYQQ